MTADEAQEGSAFKKYGVLAIALISAVVLLSGITSVTKSSPPRIVIADGTVADFGLLKVGAPFEHQFVLHNVGSQDLHITNVLTGCGCTSARLKDKLVKPDGTTTVDVTYHGQNIVGRDTIGVVIKSNDPLNPSIVLIITGKIDQDLAFFPPAIAIQASVSDKPIYKEFTIIAQFSPENTRLTCDTVLPEGMTAEIVGDGENRKLRVILDPAKLQNGNHDQTIVVNAVRSGKTLRSIRIPVYVNITKR